MSCWSWFDRLPPGFDLNRYITHVNRGITHFHASFWPLPRSISDADLESAKPPSGLEEHTSHHHSLLAGLKGGGGVGHIAADGTRTPVYKCSGHFRRCAPGETDTDGPVEFQKALVNPNQMVRLISKHLDIFQQEQLGDDVKRYSPELSFEDVETIAFPGIFKE
ncbi:hypothetical protein B0H14DRAFT_3475024 [Mycena olivaceomarginata]|nr:hypothetical protein B0H14DRAFT_3475024 [Mycena olivaceomarginata]